MNGFAPQLPLSRNPGGGYNSLQNYKQLATQHLKMIVLTSPGERVMDTSFGVGVRNFLFENDTSNVASLKQRISNQVSKYLSWVRIDNIDLFMNSDRNLLSVKITYSIPQIGVSREALSIPINQ